LADVAELVLASPDDVGMNVEVGEECKHDEHVVEEQVLAPDGKVAPQVDAVARMGQRYKELHLSIFNNTINYYIHYYSVTANNDWHRGQ